MRCRYCQVEWDSEWEYCPSCRRNFGGAVYPAQQTAQELADIDAVVLAIEASFRNVRLGDGTTIHEAELEGVYRDDSTRESARSKDPETAWSEIPDWKIERFHSALSFFDDAGWMFHIPAYMIWTLKHWRTTDSVTGDAVVDGFGRFDERSVNRFKMLSNEQSHAVYSFLHFFHKYSGEPRPETAVEDYWDQFSGPTN